MRRLNRRLNRRLVHYSTRMLNGGRRSRGHLLSQALRAFARAIKAHKRLIELAPKLFDPIEIAKEARRQEEDEKWRQVWEPALRRVYGDAAADSSAQPIGASATDVRVPKSPRTRAAMQRAQEDCELWLETGSKALSNFRRRHPHYVPAFSQIVRMFEIGFALKRLACGLPLDGPQPAPEPDPAPESDPLLLLGRIYGDNSE